MSTNNSMGKYKGGDLMRILAISCSLYGIIICLKAIKKLSWRSDTMSNTSGIYVKKEKINNTNKEREGLLWI